MSSGETRKPMNWGEIVGFALLAGVVVLLAYPGRQGSNQLLPEGMPLPPLMAKGWINTDIPVTSERLQGKVVVVDCWATWCPMCLVEMPKLAKLYAKYQPLGVEFLGLTAELEQDLPIIEKCISKIEGFDWPVGYGTMPMQDALGIQVLPTVIVFGPGGTAVWSSTNLHGIEMALDQALATVAR